MGNLTLVGLAAGAGSRFGGPKQLEPLGPAGETILDFSIHDAVRAGFGKVVLVIRDEMRPAFEAGVAARWRGTVPVELVAQHVGPGRDPASGVDAPWRTKPWGTGHAVLSAMGAVDGPFAVANADDYYGASAWEALAEYLRALPATAPWYAAVGFPLADTLTEAGTVNRAVLRTTPDGMLTSIEEVTGIARDGSGIPLDTPVSMNLWGFTPRLFPALHSAFTLFAMLGEGDDRSELFLPTFVNALVAGGQGEVKVLRGAGPWCGVTYPADTERVRSTLRELVERGEYPSPVWGS